MAIVSADERIVKIFLEILPDKSPKLHHCIISPHSAHTFIMKNKFSLHTLKDFQSHLAGCSHYIFFFFTAAFLGYIWEVLLTLILNHTLCNRGFLYGPWLPVYGFGALLFSLLLKRFSSHPVKAFFLSGIAGSLLELITGLALSNYWHSRYWDYSSLPFDISGYVSLLSFLAFGLAGSLWVCFLSPRLLKFWRSRSPKARKIFLIIFLTLFLADYALSLFFPNSGRGITY